MPDLLSAVLIDARTALLTLGPPVLLPGDPDPPGEQGEVIILAPVADTARPSYGLQASNKRIQVTCYAETLLRALALTELAKTALRPLGLRYLQLRPAPDPDSLGVLSEFRR